MSDIVISTQPQVAPIDTSSRAWISSGYGWRRHPFSGKREFHAAIDIVQRRGAPLYTCEDAYVIDVAWHTGYGLTVELVGVSGIEYLYAHTDEILVKTGQVVARGQQIATLGSSGRVTGAHLHFATSEVKCDSVVATNDQLAINLKYGVEPVNPLVVIGYVLEEDKFVCGEFDLPMGGQ